MKKKIDIEGGYKYVIDRAAFEAVRSLSNAAFMINRHINDPDASYLESGLHNRLTERAVNTLLNKDMTLAGAACAVIGPGRDGEYHLPKRYSFVDDNMALLYEE